MIYKAVKVCLKVLTKKGYPWCWDKCSVLHLTTRKGYYDYNNSS